MSTIEVVNHVTLDGVMQAPADPDEDRRGGFEHGGWATEYFDDVQGEYMGARMGKGDGALLFGRWTYDKMQSAWTQQPEDNPVRQVLERSTKYVVSRSDAPVEWMHSELLQGDAVETVRVPLHGRRFDLAVPRGRRHDLMRPGTVTALGADGRVLARRPVAAVAYWHARDGG